LDLRNTLERITILSVLLAAFWAPSWIFLLGFGNYFVNPSYRPAWISLWLLNTAIPVFPGLGTLGAVVGMAKRDRPISFLVGFLPNVMNFIIYSSLPDFGLLQIYSSLGETGFGFLTLLGAGLGLGLIGLAGSYYGDWRVEGKSGLARYSLMLFIAGLFVWTFTVWVWPGYGAAAPGLGVIF
jgi:hypothetical protein